jgi:four helix bundle protein
VGFWDSASALRLREPLMSRDHRKLNVFHQADELIVKLYAETARFPSEERFGLRVQLRRAAVSAATNIVEGCARRSQGEYLNFINVATGSASETRYLLELAYRLGFINIEVFHELEPKYTQLVKGLKKLLMAYERPKA